MKASEATKYIGKIAVLDMVNGQQLYTKIDSITADGYIQCRQLILFVMQQQNGQVAIRPVEYGAPMFQGKNKNDIDLNHVILIFDPDKNMEQVYIQITGTIVASTGPGLIMP